MLHSSGFRAISAALLFTLSGAANAAFVNAEGAYAQVSLQPFCNSAGGCTGSSFDVNGGRNETFAESEIGNAANPSDGYSRAQVNLNNPANVYLPILKAESQARSGGGARSRIAGAQGFTYSGLSNKTIDLNLILDIDLDRTASASAVAEADTIVGVFFTDQLEFYTDYSTVKNEAAPPGSFRDESILQARIGQNQSVDNLMLTDSLELFLQPGDQFVVWAGLTTKTTLGGIADAFSTFTLSFSDNAGLTAVGLPEISEVPLPAGVWLFLTGVGLVGGLSWRHKGRATS